MKTIGSLVSFLLVAAVLSGCNGEHDQSAHGHEETERGSGIAFNEKVGLLVSPTAAQWMGLKTAEVEEKAIGSAWTFSAQICGVSNSDQPSATAVAWLTGEEVEKLPVGRSVRVSCPGYQPATGRVLSVDRQVENASGMVEVRIQIGKAAISAGSAVTAVVATDAAGAVPAIPRAALMQGLEGWFVYVVNGEHFTRTAIKAGQGNEEFVEVKDGLYAGDRVVIQGGETLWLAELKFTKAGKACAH